MAFTGKDFKAMLTDKNIPFQSSNFVGGPVYFNLERHGVITTAPREVFEAFDLPNIQHLIPVGLVGFEYKESTIVKIDGASPEATYLKHGEYQIKQKDSNRVFGVPNIEAEYLRSAKPLTTQMSAFSYHVDAELYHELMAACDGLTKDTSFVIGDENTNFSMDTVYKLEESLNTYARPALVMMKSSTWQDIIRKQEAKTIPTPFFLRMHGVPTTVTTSGTEVKHTGTVTLPTGYKAGPFEYTPYWYDSSTPVFLVKDVPDNMIYFFYRDAFVMAYAKNIEKRVWEDYEKHTATGELNISMRMRRVLYPNGTTWVGVKTTNYAEDFGYSQAELKQGNLFGVTGDMDIKNTGFRAVKVKVG